MNTINKPVQSKAGKLSWSNMALKRCTSTEHLWNRKLVSLTSPMCSEIFLPRSHRSWRADVLSMPSVSMAIGSKIYWPSRSAYFSSLREAAISAAAPDRRAAALILLLLLLCVYGDVLYWTCCRLSIMSLMPTITGACIVSVAQYRGSQQ